MSGPADPRASLVEIACQRAINQADKVAYSFLSGADSTSVTYAELDARARAFGRTVRGSCPAGSRVLLILPTGLEYVAAFLGCLYAGVVAIPAYPPRGSGSARGLPRLRAVAADAQASAAITDSATLARSAALTEPGSAFAGLSWIIADEVSADAGAGWSPEPADPRALAFLQYTSGSTALPKGVMVSHRNVMANCADIESFFSLSAASRTVLWLPPYHDMGLVGGILQSLFTGYPTTLLSTAEFARSPLRWLEVISQTRATVSGGPNFGYDLCARRVTTEQVAELDLTSWQVAFNGAEPIRAEVMDRFARLLAPAGFRSDAFHPCYGLAEATLIVSGGRPAAGLVRREHQVPGGSPTTLVGCGHAAVGQDLRIVDPVTRTLLPTGSEGEIWVRGLSVAAGYWGQPAQTAETFGAFIAPGAPGDKPTGPFLRTGDLGLLDAGQLFVTGRIKDLIIQRGINHHPQDIESTASQACNGLQPGGAAAFTVPIDGEERLVLAHEVAPRHRDLDQAAARAAIRAAIAAEHELSTHDVVLVRAGRLARTSSGKIQRHAIAASYLRRELDVLAASGPQAQDGPESGKPAQYSADIARSGGAAPTGPTRELLLAAVARRLGRPVTGLDAVATGTRLGLDSLALIEVQHELELTFGVSLAPEDLYQASLDQLARQIDALVAAAPATGPTGPTAPPAGPTEPADPAGGAATTPAAGQTAGQLSHGQRGLWLLDRMSSAGGAYNLAGAIRFHGTVDARALERCIQALTDRHGALRTTFPAGPAGPVRSVAARADCPLIVHETADGDHAGGGLADVLSQTASEPFDLERGPLLCAHMWPGEQDGPVLLLVMHHIIGDFWTLSLLLRELAASYQAAFSGGSARTEAALTGAVGDYDDFVAWQARYLSSAAGHAAREYWLSELAGQLPQLALPTDRPRPAVQTFAGARHPFTLSPELSDQLAELARAEGTSVYTVLMSAFQVLLHRWTGQPDILVGSPASGRARSAVAGTAGYLVNPVVLRGRLTGDLSFRAVLAAFAGQVAQALAHQDFPFALLAEQVRSPHDPGRSPVFQAMFIYQQAPAAETSLALAAIGHRADAVELSGLVIEPLPVDQPTAQFDLTLAMARGTRQLHSSFQYNADLFDPSTIARLTESFRTLLESLARDPGTPIGRLAIFSPAERDRLVHGGNDTARPLADDRGIHKAFEVMAEARPDAIAVVRHDEQVTYRELDEHADQVAAQLWAAGIRPGDLVGVCADRSPELLAALLGVLKTGAAYVPLDPGYPAERLALAVIDTELAVILASQATQERLPSATAAVLTIAGRGAGLPAIPTRTGPWSAASAAYVLHTSGSTGIPKGVVVTHRNVLNFFAGVDEQVGCGPADTLLAVTSVAFDISVLELLWPLTRGARIVLAQDRAVGRRSARQGAGPVRPLDLSLFYFASSDQETARYRLVTEGARFADQNGFTAIWTPERHFHQFGGLYPNPAVLSAALATITHRVALRAGSVVLPLHDPIRVAEEWSLVDNLSGGRVGIAFASGWHADDFVFFPERYPDRKAQMMAALKVVHELWQGGTTEVTGGSGTKVTIRIHPAPVQPTLPTWITTAGSPDTFAQAGAIGANVLTHLLGQSVEQVAANISRYRQARADHGHDPAAGIVTLMVHAFVGSPETDISETVRAPFTAYLRSSVGLIENLVRSLDLPLDLASLTEPDRDALLAFAFDRYFESSALFGTAESVQPMLDRLSAAGVDEVACLIDFGLDDDLVLANLPHLALARQLQLERAADRDWTLAETTSAYLPTLLQCTPSTMRMIMGDPRATAGLAGLRALLLGGEALPAALAQQVLTELPGTRLLNMYGPTETTIWSAMHPVSAADNPVPIGLPMANTQVYIVNSAMEPVPVGVAGELLIGGDGVSRGYWRKPSATAERFIPDPFGPAPGARLYRTGDLARRRGDGMVEFLGRLDRQIKVHGHRIELGDIEHALERLPDITAAVVVGQGSADGDTRLVAYVVFATGAAPAQRELAQQLAAILPASLVPTAFVPLAELPMTANGKVDVRTLLRLTPAEISGRTIVPPRSGLERQIASIWSDVLGVGEVGLYDNFFDLGGHSLLIVQVHSRLREITDSEIELIKLLEYPSVGSLAAYLTSAGSVQSFQSTEDRAALQRESRRRNTRRSGQPS